MHQTICCCNPSYDTVFDTVLCMHWYKKRWKFTRMLEGLQSNIVEKASYYEGIICISHMRNLFPYTYDIAVILGEYFCMYRIRQLFQYSKLSLLSPSSDVFSVFLNIWTEAVFLAVSGTRNFKTFAPCYSQSPLPVEFTLSLDLRFNVSSNSWEWVGGGGGLGFVYIIYCSPLKVALFFILLWFI